MKKTTKNKLSSEREDMEKKEFPGQNEGRKRRNGDAGRKEIDGRKKKKTTKNKLSSEREDMEKKEFPGQNEGRKRRNGDAGRKEIDGRKKKKQKLLQQRSEVVEIMEKRKSERSPPFCDYPTSITSGEDSNIFLLPGTKKKKSKWIEKECSERTKSASCKKEEQRKLKQLQEKKKRVALETKSLKLLMKHAIGDDVCALLYSSSTVGQVESRRKRCSRAESFSKAGLMFCNEVKPLTKVGKWLTDDGDDDDDGDENDCSAENVPKKVHLEKSSRGAGLKEKEGVWVLHDNDDNDDVNDDANDNENDCSVGNFPKKTCLEKSPKGADAKEKDDIWDLDDDGSIKVCLDKSSTDASLKEEQGIRVLEDSNCDDDDSKLENACPNVVTVETRQCSQLESTTQCTGVGLDLVNTAIQPENMLDKALEGPIVVRVSRTDYIEDERKGLPIVMMEQEIMEAINANSTVIICGETGCGKTTQVPQFLYEAGYGLRGRIGITLPRRVAVLATAKRVSCELNLSLGKEVGYQVRHEKNVGEGCSLKFMTDGILLRELQSDLLLRQYSIIILDEAHERSLNTDILIGMLSRVVYLRHKVIMEQREKIHKGLEINPENTFVPLKLVLMSATLRVEDFISDRRLFHEPPVVLEVPTRQYPVTVHFSKKGDYEDYIKRALKKTMQIHRSLPPGGILVFVTGKAEVEYLCQKLRTESSQGSCKSSENSKENEDDDNDDDGVHDGDDDYSSDSDEEVIDKSNLVLNLLNEPNSLASLKAQFEVISSPNPNKEPSKKSRDLCRGLFVLPLYAMLPAEEQLRVFGAVPENKRLIVVATNVAETSLTIPGIKYVVDSGREKVKNYNYKNGMEKYEVKWISKASAAQRAGRAGRTGPGHCYRLYPSAIYSNLFEDFPSPEISKVPVAGVVLLMKSLGINKVEKFPFPTPPLPAALKEADNCLKALKALDQEGNLTHIGREMSRYPMSPRHSCMILSFIRLMRRQPQVPLSRLNLVLGYAIASAAALSFQNPFIIHSEGDDENASGLNRAGEREPRSKKVGGLRFRNRASDALTVAYLLQLHDLEGTKAKKEEFCTRNSLHFKTMDEISKLRKQLLELVFHLASSNEEFSWSYGTAHDVESSWHFSPTGYPLRKEEDELLAQAILSGWADRVAKRSLLHPKSSDKDRKARAVRYQSCGLGETVYLHPSSSVSNTPPEFLVYTDLLHTKRPYLYGITSIKAEWLVVHANALCEFSKPLLEPKPYYDHIKDRVFCWVRPTFGPHLWPLPLHGVVAEDEMIRISTFACALMEGNVLPCLGSVQKFLASSPTSLLRPELLGQIRIFNLLKEMKMGNVIIDRRLILREVWKKNPRHLRPEIECWFEDGFRHIFDEIWEKMHEEVVLDGELLFKEKRRKKASCSSAFLTLN